MQKCNHPTRLSPTLIHTADILQKSESSFLSGVSVAQKASSDSSKLVMVVDEQQSSIDSTERAWQFAVFPDSLLPLVLQVLFLASGVEQDEHASSQKPDQRGESASKPRMLDNMVSESPLCLPLCPLHLASSIPNRGQILDVVPYRLRRLLMCDLLQ